MPAEASIRKKIAVAIGLSGFGGFSVGAAYLWWLGERSAPVLVLSLAAAVVGAAAVWAGWFCGGRLLAPLERLADRTAEVAGGSSVDAEAVSSADEASPPEVRRVEESVAAVAGQLIDHRERLRENVASLERTNRELLRARDELVRAEKLASVGRLASGIAHEVGNPLNSILSVLDLMRKQREGRLVDHLESEARRIDEIINGLLDFARPGEAPVTATDPREVTEETIDLLRVQGKFDGVEVDLEGGSAGARVEANPDQLRQVLVNLLLNAADAAREGDGPPEVRIRIESDSFRGEAMDRDYSARRSDDPEGVDYRHLRRLDEPPGKFREFPLAPGDPIARIEVLDTGPGIDEETEGRIFDPFFTTREPGEGMGLGLAIAARLTDRMGGVIEAHSGPGGGSAFTVLLPIAGER